MENTVLNLSIQKDMNEQTEETKIRRRILIEQYFRQK